MGILRLVHMWVLSLREDMDLTKANRAITSAWVSAVISGVLTAVASLFGILGLDRWSFIDAALILGLGFGIYKKNRGTAITLLLYWIVAKTVQFVQSPSAAMLPLAFVFGYYFFLGIRGTFAFHRISRFQAKLVKSTEGWE